MSAGLILLTIGLGILVELIVFIGLRKLMRMDARSAAMAVAMLVILIYVPWGVLAWPGADVFAIHLALYLIVAYILGIVGSQQQEGGRRRGWHWGPAMLVAFFAFVVAVDVVFLVVSEQGITGIFAELLPKPRSSEVADSRFPGTVSHDYQKKESLYNAYLKQVEEQKARGWQVQKGWQAEPVVGAMARLRVEVRDSDGRPVADAVVSGRFLRTSSSDDDFDFTMRQVAPGRYELETVMPRPGLWRLVLHIRKGEDLHEIRATTSVAEAAG